MNIVKKSLAGLASLAAMFHASAASADVMCQFSIQSVALDSWGSVIVNLNGIGATTGSYNWYFCSTQGSVNVSNGYNSGTVTSGACAATYSQLLTMRASGSNLGLGFHGPAACNQASLPATNTFAWIALYPTFFSY